MQDMFLMFYYENDCLIVPHQALKGERVHFCSWTESIVTAL